MTNFGKEPNLTPPIVDSEAKPDTPPDVVDVPDKSLSVAEAVAGLRATLSKVNNRLEQEIAKRDAANKQIKALREELDATERILRATEPRTRTPKRPNTGKPGG